MSDISTADIVRRVAHELLPQTSAIADDITEHMLRVVPELTPGRRADEVDLLHESNEQNCGAVLSTLAFGVTAMAVSPPAATERLLQSLSAAGEDIAVLLRGYRVGQERLWRIWSAHAHSRVDAADLFKVLSISSEHLFEFVDQACEVLVQRHRHLVAAHAQDADAPASRPERVEVVRSVLGAGPLDLEAASRTLSHPLSETHLALVAAPLASEVATRRELQAMIDATGVPALVVPGDSGTWWAWLSWRSSPPADALSRLHDLAPAHVVVGMGEPGAGREGFQRSHLQALTAHRLAVTNDAPSAGVVRYRDIEVAAVLCADPSRARRLARERLGPLAGADETAMRLRETVRVLLCHGHNRASAAQQLNVHHKTVSYRIGQAEALLGRSVARDTLDIEVALVIDEVLGGV